MHSYAERIESEILIEMTKVQATCPDLAKDLDRFHVIPRSREAGARLAIQQLASRQAVPIPPSSGFERLSKLIRRLDNLGHHPS